ncbi:D-amino acid dehydrogenase [Rhodospira trueperi]|uniref:D-amino-acid dehydrogenase n=1 Tax=Rhodospira trueperi TaxID=69960 RepID=A0A1G7H2I9_9PROT|nr:D-amino acid dehydrogenase [Rhodospira trueperi]SDE94627.1 D-amino-acid dehydrogenase [Rhodospira trueperi]
MHVLVLGAGVVGATTACLLARDGHDVTVVDRQPGPGLETSFANGGQIAASHAEPWASPHLLPKLARWLGRDDAPLQFRWLRLDPALWGWGARFLLNCRSAAYARNMERAVRLALYSRDRLRALRADLSLAYDARTDGIVHVYRDSASLPVAAAAAEIMTAAGLERRRVSIEEAVALEPALADAAPSLAGAFFSPGDESGDAHLFTEAMADHAKRLGARFLYGTTTRGLIRDPANPARLTGAETDAGPIEVDAVVLALGSFSPAVARTVGLRLPVYPAKGYSITLAVREGDQAPRVSITDDEQRMVFSRLGHRLRCAGTAALEGWSTSLNPTRVALTVRNATSLFPRGGDYDDPQPWCGLRPATPDSVPILGLAPRFENLWLNTGHGTMGWAMAAGSAQITADLIAGRGTAIDVSDLGAGRFHGI